MNLVGRIVKHKLLGTCMLLSVPEKGMWQIRMPDTNILLVHQEELELEEPKVKVKTKADQLREMGLAAINLGEAALREAEALDAKTTK